MRCNKITINRLERWHFIISQIHIYRKMGEQNTGLYIVYIYARRTHNRQTYKTNTIWIIKTKDEWKRAGGKTMKKWQSKSTKWQNKLDYIRNPDVSPLSFQLVWVLTSIGDYRINSNWVGSRSINVFFHRILIDFSFLLCEPTDKICDRQAHFRRKPLCPALVW